MKEKSQRLPRWDFLFKIYALLIVSACGSMDRQLTAGVESRRTSPSAGESYQREVGAARAGEDGDLFLTQVDQFKILVNGCQSGFQVNLTEVNPQANFYRYDTNCLGKLLEFTLGGKRYTPVPGSDFTTYLVGDTATFISADSTTTWAVLIVSQLSSPLTSGASINYQFRKVVGSSQNPTILGILSGPTARIQVLTVKAPRFNLKAKSLLSAVGSNQSLQLKFTLECQIALTKPNQLSNVACDGTKLVNTRYVLVKDTFNSVPCTTTNPSGCRNLFNGSERYIDTSTVDYITPGTQGLPNGGFQTKVSTAEALATPANFFSSPNLILVLSNGTSYQYFNLDITVTSTF